ncbi:MAG: type II toxin-antitoxin system VapC family toxin [Parvularculaceae bacterium]
MILPDVNVLIYAFRQDSAQHREARRWLTGVIEGDAAFGVARLTLAAVIRITTDPRLTYEPSDLEEAFNFCKDVIDQPLCRIVEPGERHWDIFRRLCVENDVRGPRVSDAWFAALAIEHGCEWITYDRDYARFPDLKWRTPRGE